MTLQYCSTARLDYYLLMTFGGLPYVVKVARLWIKTRRSMYDEHTGFQAAVDS